MSDFDQSLYNAVMADNHRELMESDCVPTNEYQAGIRHGATIAARISAERQPVIPEGWYIVHAWSCPRATGDYAEVRIAQWRHGMIAIERNGTGSSINEAFHAAIDAAKEMTNE